MPRFLKPQKSDFGDAVYEFKTVFGLDYEAFHDAALAIKQDMDAFDKTAELITANGVKACLALPPPDQRNVAQGEIPVKNFANHFVMAYAWYTCTRTDISASRKVQIYSVLKRIDPWLSEGGVMTRGDIVKIITNPYTTKDGSAPTKWTHKGHIVVVKQFARFMFGRRLFSKMSKVEPIPSEDLFKPNLNEFQDRI
jgi:hypothetical protein